MSKSKGDNGEYEFTRAAYDELRDAEQVYGVEFHVTCEPSSQRGVWELIVVAVDKGTNEGVLYAARYQASWPNSMAVSFAAFLYGACHRTVRMVEAWYADRARNESDAGR